jgi:hypothetical protein
MTHDWDRQQVAEQAKQIQKRWGGLWPHISPSVRRALVDAHVVEVIRSVSSSSPTVDCIAIMNLSDNLAAKLECE